MNWVIEQEDKGGWARKRARILGSRGQRMERRRIWKLAESWERYGMGSAVRRSATERLFLTTPGRSHDCLVQLRRPPFPSHICSR